MLLFGKTTNMHMHAYLLTPKNKPKPHKSQSNHNLQKTDQNGKDWKDGVL